MSISKRNAADFLVVGERYFTGSADALAKIIATGPHAAVAIAIWLYLISKPPEWLVRRTDVMSSINISKQKYANGMKALDAAGVVRRVSVMKDGKLAGTRVLVSASFIRDEDIERGQSPSVQFSRRSTNATGRIDEHSENLTGRAGGHLVSTGDLTRTGSATNDGLIDKRAAKKRASPVFANPPDGWSLEEWVAYLEARRGKGHPRTEASLQLCIGNIYKTRDAGIPMRLIIDEMVATGWRTVKPEFFENKKHEKSSNTSQKRQSVVDRVAAATGLDPDDPNSYDFEQFSDEHNRRDGPSDGGQVVVVDGDIIRE